MCKIDKNGKLKCVASEQIIYDLPYRLNIRTVQISNQCKKGNIRNITYKLNWRF